MESNAYDETPLTGTVPTGTVTFVFTDIEGSTRLWEQHPQTMQTALARHDALLKQAIAATGGHFVKSTGDGSLAVFPTALSALAAAVRMQQSLQAEKWAEIQPHVVRVRIGVHTGEAETRDGDYYGSALNRAARLMAVGYGGQVLVSNSTMAVAVDKLPTGTSLLDLGEFRLKDLVRPEHIYQLAHPDLPRTFPPLHSLDAYPHNLPIQLTSFVGREREMTEANRLLQTTRLLTLVGPGGTGKTRLSLQLAAEVLPGFKDGAWLVELAPLHDPEQMAQTIASTFDLQGVPAITALDVISGFLRGKQLLLILDNCEHLIDAAARLGDHLLHACPQLKLLITSREALGISGEVSYRVPSLSLPDMAEPTPQTLVLCESAQLFIERATAANPRFVLSGDNAPAIAQICRRLDGIPLALELAAARTKAFSVDQIVTRLDDRFRLLTGGSRTALPRQQTLRALIDWSYDLLPEAERTLLRQLSVFVGGWTFEAAEAICPTLDVLDLLPQLVNKSLVLLDEQAGGTRYRLLETIRQYARDRLLEAGESAAARDRHLDYFLALSEQAEPELRGAHAFDWIDQLDPDFDNIQVSIEWGQEQRLEDSLHLVGNLIFFWPYRADLNAATRWLISAIQRLDALPAVEGVAAAQRAAVRARFLLVLGFNPIMRYSDDAMAWMHKAREMYRSLNDPYMLAVALRFLAALSWHRSDVATLRSAALEAQALSDEVDQTPLRLTVLMAQAFVASLDGDRQAWQSYHDEIRWLIIHYEHPSFMNVLMGMTHTAMLAGEWDRARLYNQQGLKLAKRLKSRYFVTFIESQFVHILRQQGDLPAARAGYRRTIQLWLDLGDRGMVANQLACFGYLARAEHEFVRAARLLGASEPLRAVAKQTMAFFERTEYDREVAVLRSQMDAAELAAAWAEGRGMSLEQAVGYATSPETAPQTEKPPTS